MTAVLPQALTRVEQRDLRRMVERLENAYKRHGHILKHGTTDPFWHDGENLNLVWGHIVYWRREIRHFCKERELDVPEVAQRHVPSRTPNDWCLRCERGCCPVRLRDEKRKQWVQMISEPSAKQLSLF